MNTILKTRVDKHSFAGTEAIKLTADSYSAIVLPEFGGNLVSFVETEKGYSFLRTPPDIETLLQSPTEYGIPVLFPPNRYEDGMFTINGRIYQFPINELERNNHCHGFLLTLPWKVAESGADRDSAYVTLMQLVDEHHPAYQYFPHSFSIQMRYTLSPDGMSQSIRVVNTGHDPMPFMLGFHTTLNVPFAPNSTAEDYAIQATIGERWEMSNRMLPTGAVLPLNCEERTMKDTGVSPFFSQLDNHYTASPRNGRNFMTLTDRRLGVQLVYDVGLNYKHWMTFNNFGKGEFICPEPQTSIVNAPNVQLPDRGSGLIMLNSGEEWEATSRLYVKYSLES